MIGRIYRPNDIHITPNRRGVAIHGQYKSHFGKKGTYALELNFVFNKKTEEEDIVLACQTDGIACLSHLTYDHAFFVREEDITLRKLYLPQEITTKDDLRIVVPIKSLTDDYTDVLHLRIAIVRSGNEEQLVIHGETEKKQRIVQEK